MEFIIIAILVIAVLAFIAYPLFTAPEQEPAPTANALDELIAQRDSAYDAIRDLDFDHQMGKLSQRDYETLRDKYKARAAHALQQIDQVAGRDGMEARIEEEVTRLRQRGMRTNSTAGANATSLPPGDEIEEQVALVRKQSKPATNGDALEQEVAKLRATRKATAGNRCPHCGASARPGDRFCSKCGKEI